MLHKTFAAMKRILPNFLTTPVRSNFNRVDFYGYGPGTFELQVTSVLFKDSCFLFKGSKLRERGQEF